MGTPGVEEVPLVFFRGSLLISMLGLFFAPLDEPHQFQQVAATGLAYLTLISGVVVTVPSAWPRCKRDPTPENNG